MKALIVGAGIAGLATGIALALRGWKVEIFEQADALTEVGAGLQISPNGMHVLKALGVLPNLQDTVFEPEAIEMRLGVSGRRVFHLPMKGLAERRWGAPYMHVHRADLLAALQARFDALCPGAIHLGAKIEGSAPDRGLKLNGVFHDADLCVGADGLRSTVRRHLFGASKPRYTGHLAWRAVVPLDRLSKPTPPTACVWAGDKRHAVTTRLRGGGLVNFVGIVETEEPSEEGWRIEGTREDVMRDFQGWAPEIAGILQNASTFHRWALFDRPPLPAWSAGRTVLVGDAAHPMLPSMAQGAVQALEDAWVLADLVSAAQPVEEALRRFYQNRIARTSRIQQGSLKNATMFHQASPLGRLLFYTPMAIGARLVPELIHRRQDWVYRHNVVNPC